MFEVVAPFGVTAPKTARLRGGMKSCGRAECAAHDAKRREAQVRLGLGTDISYLLRSKANMPHLNARNPSSETSGHKPMISSPQSSFPSSTVCLRCLGFSPRSFISLSHSFCVMRASVGKAGSDVEFEN